MEILKDRYSITELSQRLNVTDHALRYYEKEFNINVPKDQRGRRYYTPELANLMYQIKSMRDEGLEIKAIKKILISENIITESPVTVLDENPVSIVPAGSGRNIEIRQFFDEFKNQLAESFSLEINSVKDHISREMNKTKLELGACVENSVRRLESKLERHFQEVDNSISMWREKNKKGFFKRLLTRYKK